jgi:hypothetical protein
MQSQSTVTNFSDYETEALNSNKNKTKVHEQIDTHTQTRIPDPG